MKYQSPIFLGVGGGRYLVFPTLFPSPKLMKSQKSHLFGGGWEVLKLSNFVHEPKTDEILYFWG